MKNQERIINQLRIENFDTGLLKTATYQEELKALNEAKYNTGSTLGIVGRPSERVYDNGDSDIIQKNSNLTKNVFRDQAGSHEHVDKDAEFNRQIKFDSDRDNPNEAMWEMLMTKIKDIKAI